MLLWNLSPHRAIFLTKISVALTCSWPPSMNASKTEIFRYKIAWHLTFFSAIFLALPIINGMYTHIDDPVVFGKLCCLFFAVLQLNIKMIICRTYQSQLQMAYTEMEHFCNHAHENELNVFKRYVDQCKYIYAMFIVSAYLTSILIILGPLVLSQPLPTDATYPFSVESQPIRSIIYFHQALVGLQASSCVTIDCQIGLLIWFIVAKFDIVANKMNRIKNREDMINCIIMYQNTLRFATETIHVIRLLPLMTVVATAFAMVFGGLSALSNNGLAVKLQFLVLGTCASVELLMCAWAGDNLACSNDVVHLSTYNLNWYNFDVSTQRYIYHILLQTQKPVVIGVAGVLPSLSLQYYTTFLQRSFSYFTALRIIFGKEEP